MAGDASGRGPRREPAPERDRKRAWRGGRWAESLAVWRLRCTGYRILARNWRSPMGEIDIVARRGRILAVVEVKQRPDLATALQAISPRQQARLARAALGFQARRRDCAGLNLRFDVITLGPGFWPHHLKDAWRPSAE
ncbi:MAG TPA: YraN family protein [Dongiaceae bacterium]|nr:YraN family protein [Dongiaceae bacterium]